MTDLSLVICTRNRAEKLRRALGAVAQIESEYDWELVIVENACTDHTGEVIADFADHSSLPVRHVVESESGKGHALNTGCAAAGGRVIALTDDDCYPSPDLVDEWMEVFETRNVGYVGGRVLRYQDSDADFSVRKGDEPQLLSPETFPKTGFIIGANMAFLREVFVEIGGYDELLGAGTPFVCADIEFCARASHHGWRGGFFPGPTVYHDHGRKPGEAVERLRADYDRGRGAYYAKTLLELSSLRVQCLKWWYWDLSLAEWGQTRRELCGAFRYSVRRLRQRLVGSTA